jgi:prevent-host-death family protein
MATGFRFVDTPHGVPRYRRLTHGGSPSFRNLSLIRPVTACLVHYVSQLSIMPVSSAKSSGRRKTAGAPLARGSSAGTINVHAAKTHLSRILKRVERGERITIARGGKPVAIIAPVPAGDRSPLPLDDPLLRVDEYAFDGPVGKLTNAEIDRIVYGV